MLFGAFKFNLCYYEIESLSHPLTHIAINGCAFINHY